MKLQFELWIEKRSFSSAVNTIFEESITCYKASAYRSAFLMSYLGFMQIIKERLINGNRPDGVEHGEWEHKLKQLRDDDKWEVEVYTTLTKNKDKNKDKYFIISQNIRDDISFFKQRRNDCAHAKSTIIESAHVEVLWSFLKSNLDKMVLKGGKQSLLLEIERHFDYSYTDPSKTMNHLIEKIPSSIENGEIKDFLSELIEIVDFTESEFFEKHEGDSSKKNTFWKSMFQLNNQNLTENIVEFLSQKEDLFTVFIVRNPSYLEYFNVYSGQIRRLWTKKIYRELNTSDFDCWPLVTYILRNKIIENREERKEFMKGIVKNLSPYNYPQEQHIGLLNQNGFKPLLKAKAIDIFNGDYIKVNNKSSIFMFYLTTYGLDAAIFDKLDKLYKGYSYGKFDERLRELIRTNEFVANSFIDYKEKNTKKVDESNILGLFPD